MAKDKKSVLVYVDWISTFEELEDIEAGKLIKHFFRYVNDLNPEAPDRLTRLVFEPIKQSLKRDLVKYENIRSKNKENAEKRWQNKNATAYDRTNNDAKNADSDSVIDSDSVSDIDKEKKIRKVFIKPSVFEIAKYCEERGNNIKADQFYNHYTSNGWMVGKNKMKDWKAAIRTWENNNQSQNGKTFKSDSVRNDNQSIASTVNVIQA